MPENALQADNKDVRLGHDHWVLSEIGCALNQTLQVHVFYCKAWTCTPTA